MYYLLILSGVTMPCKVLGQPSEQWTYFGLIKPALNLRPGPHAFARLSWQNPLHHELPRQMLANLLLVAFLAPSIFIHSPALRDIDYILEHFGVWSSWLPGLVQWDGLGVHALKVGAISPVQFLQGRRRWHIAWHYFNTPSSDGFFYKYGLVVPQSTRGDVGL